MTERLVASPQHRGFHEMRLHKFLIGGTTLCRHALGGALSVSLRNRTELALHVHTHAGVP